jgi:CheY-like chemotaxis protein
VLDLNQVVAEIAPMLRRIIGDDILLEVTADPMLRRTRADRGQLEQVIVNLAANGRDAMPDGGKLTISTQNAIDAEGRSWARMCISDTGSGMDAATSEHIFEPFFTTKGSGRGTGLGLATVFGIVRQSGGNVTVESSPGNGSSFCIDLPESDSELDAVAAPTAQHVPHVGHETVLVVEDEPAVLGFAAQLLERHGYTVLRASTGEEAVDLAKRFPGRIDLLFSDLVMPGISGYETAAAVRVLRPEIRHLFASGYSEELNANRASTAHLPFIEKPYGMDTCLQAIRAARRGDN